MTHCSTAPPALRLVVTGALLLLALVLGVALPATALPATASAAMARPATPDEAARPGPVVVIGMTGLRWDDVTSASTPALFSLLQDGATGNLITRSVRSSACPADGWLAISAGRRAADLPMTEFGSCRRLVSPTSPGTAVPGWSDFLLSAEEAPYGAHPGTLGDAVAAAGIPAAGLGPGAAIALAGSDGVPVGSHSPAVRAPSRVRAAVSQALSGAELLVIDLGSIRDRNRPLVYVDEGELQRAAETPAAPPAAPIDGPPSTADWTLSAPTRAEQVEALEARFDAALTAVREQAPTATVLVVSLSDSGTIPTMQLAALTELGAPAPATLGSTSTQQQTMVQATDVTPTITGLLGLELEGLTGSPMAAVSPSAGGAATPLAQLERLTDVATHASAIRPLVAGFHTVLVLVNLLLFGAFALGLNANFLRSLSGSVRRFAPLGRRLLSGSGATTLLRSLRAVAPAIAALPVASYLANALPWWRAENPGLALWGGVLGFAVAVGALATIGPWRRHLLAPVAVVAGVTGAVLAADVLLLGSTLQMSSLMGYQALVGARFHGFGNSTFALFSTASVLVAVCLGEPLVRRGWRWRAAVVIALVGLTAALVDGHPRIGADFGGPPAIIPAFVILVLLTLEVRLTWKRVALVLGVSALAAASFSILDWLRPPDQRSHLGNFVQTVIDGGGLDVISRKLGQNLTNLFGSTLTLLAAAGVVLLVMVISKPLGDAARQTRSGRSGYAWLAPDATVGRLTQDAVMLKPGIWALGTLWLIGFAINDSGVVIPAIGISLAVPLIVAVVCTWLLRLRAEGGIHWAGQPAPAGQAYLMP